MNSMPADVDVNAQWHHRDTVGAIRSIVIINITLLGARLSARESVCLTGTHVYLCSVYTLHVHERI